MSWIEARLTEGATPADLYNWLPRQPQSAHHFWDEPWWPGAFVVRLRGPRASTVERCPLVEEVVEWDPAPDQDYFRDEWKAAEAFFAASSALPLKPLGGTGKYLHCFLNARGMSTWQEAKFAFRFGWNRLTIPFRWRLYLRRRWEREQG